MRIQIPPRHAQVPEPVRRRAEARFDRLPAAGIVFEEEKGAGSGEGILHIDGSDPVVAAAEAPGFGGAVDRVVDRLGRPPRRRRGRGRDRPAAPLKESVRE